MKELQKNLLALAVTALVSSAHATPINISWDGTGNPTTLDSNGDTVSDWVVRNDGPYTGTSAGGVWQGGQFLDTRPLFKFDSDFNVDMKWRSDGANNWDALFWVNIDRLPTAWSAVYMFLKDVGASQTLEVYGKAQPGDGGTLLKTYTGLADAFINTRFAFNPANNLLTVTIDGTAQTPFNYLSGTPNGNADAFATIGGGKMRLDSYKIPGATQSVPDGGMTIALFSLGLLGLGALRRKL